MIKFNIKKEALLKLIEGNESDDLTLDSGIFTIEGAKLFTDDDISQIKNNFANNGKTEAQKEFLKNAVEKAGLQGEFKSIDNIFDEVKKQALKDAKIEPDKKISELQKQLETAQNNITEKEKLLSNKDKEIEQINVNSIIFSKLPEKIPGNLTRQEAAQILKMNSNFIKENNNYYPLVDGNKMQDDKGNFISYESFIESKINEKGWNSQTGGNTPGKGGDHGSLGGQNSVNSTSDIKNFKDFDVYIKKNNITKSEDANKIMVLAMKNEGFKAE